MLVRTCAGGVAFHGDQVFLLQNDKKEWVLPKGVIRSGDLARDVALRRMASEAGVMAEVVSTAGETTYEFYSISRRAPVCNRVTWYIMKAASADYRVAFDQGFLDGGWFPIEPAVERITYSQDRALLRLAWEKYCSLERAQ